MQELEKALKDVKVLHEQWIGRPAPEPTPTSHVPFPPGVDPQSHALAEVQRLKELAERLSFAPRPSAWVPPADSFVTDDEIVVRLEIPGVSREDVHVHVVGSECVVRGERKPPMCEADARPMHVERTWGPFERRFFVPLGGRIEEMKARIQDGLLELRIPLKPTAAEERDIEVA